MLIPKVLSVLITLSGFLPNRDSQFYTSPISIPNAITKLYPLPQQEMTLSYSRGQSYLASGRFQQALLEFERCIDIKPDNVEFYYSKGIGKNRYRYHYHHHYHYDHHYHNYHHHHYHHHHQLKKNYYYGMRLLVIIKKLLI